MEATKSKWIPAFAGMTAPPDGAAMTAPTRRRRDDAAPYNGVGIAPPRIPQKPPIPLRLYALRLRPPLTAAAPPKTRKGRREWKPPSTRSY